jgi:hypothetical protein
MGNLHRWPFPTVTMATIMKSDNWSVLYEIGREVSTIEFTQIFREKTMHPECRDKLIVWHAEWVCVVLMTTNEFNITNSSFQFCLIKLLDVAEQRWRFFPRVNKIHISGLSKCHQEIEAHASCLTITALFPSDLINGERSFVDYIWWRFLEHRPNVRLFL